MTRAEALKIDVSPWVDAVLKHISATEAEKMMDWITAVIPDIYYVTEKPTAEGWYYVRKGGNERIARVIERHKVLEFMWLGRYYNVESATGFEFSSVPVPDCAG